MMSVMDGVRETFAAMSAPEPAGWTRRKLYAHPGANLNPWKFRGRWMPHQGAREMARRRRQREALMRKANAEPFNVTELREAMSDFMTPLTGFFEVVGELQPYHEEAIKALTDPNVTGIKFIPENRLGMSLMPSDKPAVIGQVQDSGNPVGKRVSWTSNGVQKVGEITHVVPAGKFPADVGAKIKDVGSYRDHESFVVQANGKTYWPRVSLLNFE